MKAQSSSVDSLETYTPRIIALSLLAILVLLALTGCSKETHPATDFNPTGTYSLVSVDGQSVPCSVTHEGNSLTIKSGVFTIKSDGSCFSLMVFALPGHDDVRREVKATYTQKGNELTMQWEGAGATKGQVNGNQYTMTNEGMVLSYRK